MIELTFALLRRVNQRRCESPQGFDHPLPSWSVAEWTNAMAGEAGEACNIAKKLLRFRDGVRGNAATDTEASLRAALGEELADAVIYADLVATSQGLSLEDLVRAKFNAKSDEIGSYEKL